MSDEARDPEVTMVPCLACDGTFRCIEDLPDGRHRMTTCRWCSGGAQTPEQIKAWKKRKR